ncbi:MAG: DUF1844 domain-containing protein [Actinobacteria bacterium]|nr:DUF1844 domain-containing protein [Actinomycetota bacterium]
MADANPGAPKLHIDSDWKAAAQAEKDRLREHEQAKQAAAPDAHELPDPSMTALLDMLASQAVMGLGAYADPKTGGIVIDLPGAKFGIDLLQVVEEKTRGNLSSEESEHLKRLLAELRSRFVQIVRLMEQQAARGGSVGSGGATGAGGPGSGAAASGSSPKPTIQVP